MKRLPVVLALLACLTAAVFYVAPSGSGAVPLPPRAPKSFFGIAPQTPLTDEDVEYMKAGGISTIRWPMVWEAIQPTRTGGYDWSSFDPVVSVAARHGMKVLPFVFATPKWLAGKYTTEPINNALQRREWKRFLEAAVKRYGPGGEYWKTHAAGVVQYEPAVPEIAIRSWQVWNEANFFYFAYPASPQRYARLLKQSAPVIKRVDPGAQVIMSGLFGAPTAHGPKGMPAAEFLEHVYAIPGMKNYFDAVALHPYAVDTETLEELVNDFHEVTVENHDRVPLYVTEMGWGSQNDFKTVAFEQGPQGQVEELRNAYAFLIANRNRLGLKQVFWYSWKDLKESCSFCDSVGLFQGGLKFKPKPAWRAFVSITGGKVRP